MLPQPPKPTPSAKFRIASRLYATARKVKSAALRRKHPDWNDEQIEAEWKRRFFLMRD